MSKIKTPPGVRATKKCTKTRLLWLIYVLVLLVRRAAKETDGRTAKALLVDLDATLNDAGIVVATEREAG